MQVDYIKLNRKILDWEWWDDINTCRFFIFCLLKANWKEGKFRGQIIERGSFVSSIPKISEQTGLTEREVRTAIKHLKATGEVTVKTSNKYSVFTVNNYCTYQVNDMQIDRQETDKGQARDKQETDNRQSNDSLTTTIEEKKEYKEGKKGRKEEGKKEKREGAIAPKKKGAPVYYPNDAKLNQAFADYVAMRKEIKKPMTDRAVTLAMTKLKDLSKGDNDVAVLILEQSIFSGWQGLFALKQDKKSGGNVFDEWRGA